MTDSITAGTITCFRPHGDPNGEIAGTLEFENGIFVLRLHDSYQPDDEVKEHVKDLNEFFSNLPDGGEGMTDEGVITTINPLLQDGMIVLNEQERNALETTIESLSEESFRVKFTDKIGIDNSKPTLPNDQFSSIVRRQRHAGGQNGLG